ncbi:hypothetical protein [Nisaea sediminum]|uniref:hypothetical protein n=1 Tax=Nisaea sediminum TaxID=2775867 RepID=UPI00186767CF|nr:hypothetical protein [Nisaea sediminum]
MCNAPTAPAREYQVLVRFKNGEHTTTQVGRSREMAICRAWRDYREVDEDITYLDFKRRCRAFLLPARRPDDAYDYVRGYYGLEVSPGDRIRACGMTGTVVHPKSHRHYVHFIEDGKDFSVPVHPDDVIVIGKAAGDHRHDDHQDDVEAIPF